MERHGAVSAGTARERLRAARQAQDASVRRAVASGGLILAFSVFCGAQTFGPAHRGFGNVLTIIAAVWCLAELLRMSARNQWRPLRSWPKPRWDLVEVTLISVAVIVGAVVGPHLRAGSGNSAPVSWVLAGAVTVVVAVCLFAARASYRRRVRGSDERRVI